MQRIMIAGAAQTIGLHLLKEVRVRGLEYKALSANSNILLQMGLKPEEIIPANPQQAASLKGAFKGGDVLISNLGFHEGLNLRANLNLLNELHCSGLKEIILILPLRRQAKLPAKEAFLKQAIKDKGLKLKTFHCNVLFHELYPLLESAEKERLSILGSGDFRINPLHPADLACAILDEWNSDSSQFSLGGPEAFSQLELCKLAYNAHHKEPRIIKLPSTLKAFYPLLLMFRKTQDYSAIDWLKTMKSDCIAPASGIHRLRVSFREEAERIQDQ